jgi:hypothetical protein
MMAKAKKRGNQPNHIPTPKEIRIACAEIRRGWSEEQHWVRATGVLLSEAAERQAWTPPVVSAAGLGP